MLDLFKDDLVLGTEIGAFAQFFYFLVKKFAPFVFVVQIEDVVHDMVLIKVQAQPIDKALMKGKIIRSEFFIGLAALDRSAKTSFVIDRYGIKIMVTDLNLFLVQQDIRIKTNIETIVVLMGMGQNTTRHHWLQGHPFTIVDIGHGIIDRRDELRHLHIEFSIIAFFGFPERVDIFGSI